MLPYVPPQKPTRTLRAPLPVRRASSFPAAARCGGLHAVLLGVVSVLAGGFLWSCSVPASARPAPFRIRPDSVEPGSLMGPFSGRVLDAANRTPIAGALVYAAWSMESAGGPSAPAGVHEVVASTNAAGGYDIPQLKHLPSGVRVTDFTLLVYRRGFIAYRSDRRFQDFGTRLDFAQTSNQILLERWRSELSHARHLRYIGGGNAVAGLTQWEADEAAAELSDESRGRRGLRDNTAARGPLLVAAQLLSGGDIKSLTKYDGDFETGPLSDEPDTATYSSQHFKALGRAETWDVALRMWRLDAGAVQERYEELTSTLPGVTEKDEIGSRSFRASESSIRGVGFLDGPRGVVVLLTCGSNQCTEENALALAQTVYDRIKVLVPDGTPRVEAPAEEKSP